VIFSAHVKAIAYHLNPGYCKGEESRHWAASASREQLIKLYPAAIPA